MSLLGLVSGATTHLFIFKETTMRAMIFACLLLCGCKSLMTPQQQETAMNTCHKHHLTASVREEFDNFFLWGDYGVVAIHCYPKGD